MRNFLFLLFISFGTNIFAQYTNVINSKRPGFSESPFALGTKVYQVEGGFFYQKSDEENLGSLQESYGSDWFLRAGVLSERLEFNVNLKYQQNSYLFQTLPELQKKISGISEFTIGAKYLIYSPTYKNPKDEIRSWKAKWKFDKKRLIPAVGIYAGLNSNFLSEDYKLETLSPKVALLLQNDFDDYTIWVNNLYVNYFNIEGKRTYGYISTLSYSMTDRFSIFAEHQGEFIEGEKQFKLGGGMAFLINQNWQVGLNANWDMKMNHLNLYGGLGASWRYDAHKEVFKFKNENRKKDGSGKIQNKKSVQKKLKKKKK